MLGYIEFAASGTKARLVRETRCGASFLVLDMGKGALGAFSALRAARAAERMYAQGVRRAVFPVDFPHTAIFLRRGIIPVDPLPLRRALSARFVKNQLALAGMANRDALVAVSGEQMNGEIEKTVLELTQSYRYVMLSVRSGGEEFADRMRRQYGVSLLLAPSVDRLECADALVLFSPREDISCKNRILCALYPGGEERGRVPLVLDDAISSAVAANCSHEQLAAALYGLGHMPAERFLGEIAC